MPEFFLECHVSEDSRKKAGQNLLSDMSTGSAEVCELKIIRSREIPLQRNDQELHVVGCNRTSRPKKVNLSKKEVSPMQGSKKRELKVFENYVFLKKGNDTSLRKYTLLKFQTFTRETGDFNFEMFSFIKINF